jgi:hypothetical protein
MLRPSAFFQKELLFHRKDSITKKHEILKEIAYFDLAMLNI